MWTVTVEHHMHGDTLPCSQLHAHPYLRLDFISSREQQTEAHMHRSQMSLVIVIPPLFTLLARTPAWIKLLCNRTSSVHALPGFSELRKTRFQRQAPSPPPQRL